MLVFLLPGLSFLFPTDAVILINVNCSVTTPSMNIKQSAQQLLLALSISTLSSIGLACETKPTDFLVFSRGDISYENSDFQGITGAGGHTNFVNFLARNNVKELQCATLITAGNIVLHQGGVENGGIEAGGSVQLSKAHVDGKIYKKSAVAQFTAQNASNYFIQASSLLSTWPTTHKATTTADGYTHFVGESAKYAVYNMTAAEFDMNSVLTFNGPADAYIIINVSGANISLSQKDMYLNGGIGFGHVLINFHQATNLTIQASGNYQYGIPASILAPYAMTNFFNGLISGGLYVGSLCGNGQINPGKFLAWPQVALAPAPPPLACIAPLKCH